MADQRKTAADYGQLSLFAEVVPDWLQPAEPTSPPPAVAADPAKALPDEDDDLGQFMHWLQHSRTPDTNSN